MLKTLTLLLISSLSLLANADDNCEKIMCDCSSLSSDSWRTLCQQKEAALIKQCKSANTEDIRLCSIYGSAATHPLLSPNEKKIGAENHKAVQLLRHKYAAVYWSARQDIDAIENAVKNREFVVADQRLQLLQLNQENLLKLQEQLSSLLTSKVKKSQIDAVWHSFADGNKAISSSLSAVVETLNSATYKKSKPAAELAIKMLTASGDLYEQIGYSYTRAEQHKLASKYWKIASSISSKLLTIAEKNGDEENADFYRYQAATRLHLATTKRD